VWRWWLWKIVGQMLEELSKEHFKLVIDRWEMVIGIVGA
jgi:hypothetical protein